MIPFSVQSVAASVLALLALVSGVLVMGTSDTAGSAGNTWSGTRTTPDTPAEPGQPVSASPVAVTSPEEVAEVFSGGLEGVTHPGQRLAAVPRSGGTLPPDAVALTINDGCNSGNGVITVDGNGVLSTRGFATTRMACPGDKAAAAAAFHSVVADGAVLLKDGDTYWISRADKALQFVPSGRR